MKQTYVCEVTGVEFGDAEKCLAHEAEYREKRESFEKLVMSFVEELEKSGEIEVDRDTLEYGDGLSYALEGYYYDFRYIKFEYYDVIEGTFEKFHVDSDPVGDYRFEWGYGETVESLVSAFENERIRVIDSVSGFLGKTESFGGEIFLVDGENLSSYLEMYQDHFIEVRIKNRLMIPKK